MARTARSQTEIRTALKSRPNVAGQRFEEAVAVRPSESFYCAFPNFGDRIGFVERFEQRPALKAVLDTFTASVAAAEMVAAMIANRNFSVGGTNMTTALCTFDAEFGIKLTTAGADNDQGILWPQLSTNQTAWTGITWGFDREVEWGVLLKTGSAITDQAIYAGLKLTGALDLTTDADGAFFRYSTEGSVSTANWTYCYSIGGTDYEYDSGVAVEASTIYDLRVIVDDARVARFYINGNLVGTSLALTTAVDPEPYVGIQALAGAAKHFSVAAQAISRKAA